MKKWKNPFRFTSVFKPMVYLFLFSLLYGYGTLWLLSLPDPWNELLRTIWLAFFGLGLYFVCTLIWGKKRKTLALKKSGEVFLVCLALNLFTAYCISPLSLVSGNLALSLTGAILGTLFLLLALPSLILFFQAVYEGRSGWKEQVDFVLNAWKERFWYILNLWLLLFVLMFVWDNLMGGPLYAGARFDAPSIFTTLLFLKEPTIYFEMILVLSNGASGTWELVMLGVMESLLMVFLECNIISWYGHAARKANTVPLDESSQMPAGAAGKTKSSNRK